MPLFYSPVLAQDTPFNAKHAAIIFPYPMYKEKWRSSIGLLLTTTPKDITEEFGMRVPCIDYHLLRRINNEFILDNRLLFQGLQNQISTGVHFVKPLNNKFYLGVGDEIGFWFGLLKITSFDTKGLGFINYPNISLGFKTKKNLLITFKAEASFNLYYQAELGEEKFTSGKNFYNGGTFTIALEQPFFKHQHLTLAFSATNNYFYWQTWALFYEANHTEFYPQLTIGFIL